jgi:hypothetical protein
VSSAHGGREIPRCARNDEGKVSSQVLGLMNTQERARHAAPLTSGRIKTKHSGEECAAVLHPYKVD